MDSDSINPLEDVSDLQSYEYFGCLIAVIGADTPLDTVAALRYTTVDAAGWQTSSEIARGAGVTP